jgi:hypothetical protein
MDEKIQHSILMTSLIALAALLFIWAAFIRKPSRGRRKHHHSADPRPQSNTEFLKARKRRKRRRKERLPMNPTLAETRGLPPIRDDHRSSGDHYQS